MNSTTRRTLTMAIASLLVIAACAGGDDEEYNENGQLVEKTDVRVVGVDLGRAVDVGEHITNETDVFAPGDTIYASVRTTGSSPKTILGVRWKNPEGDEIGGNNLLIRPTGDTSTLFAFRYMANRSTGPYTLDVRVNGKMVKTTRFVVSTTAEPRPVSTLADRPLSSAETPADRPTHLAAIRLFARRNFARLTGAVASLFDRAPNEQSPFEWRGIRAGMRFSRLDRLSKPGTPWKCTPFLLSAVGIERYTAEDNDLGSGHATAMVDTVGQRVVDVQFGLTWKPAGTSGRVAFDHEMNALAAEWDKLPGVIRHPRKEQEGPSIAQWETADSLWRARMWYDQGPRTPVHPESFEIEEIHWNDTILARVTDSLKGQMRNPASEYYRTPNTACAAVLQSH
jgi:hypothetical protein